MLVLKVTGYIVTTQKYVIHIMEDNIREYMRALARKSVEVQAKKYGKKKFKEMGKLSGISKRKKIREILKEKGEIIEHIVLN